MPSSKGPTDNRREAAKEQMAQAIRSGDDATVIGMIREANRGPRTGAGKRLLVFLRSRTNYGRFLNTAEGEDIASIEAEAVADERARIRAAVEGLPIWLPGTQSPRLHGSPEADDYWREVVALPAVLAIIDGDAG